MNSVRLNLIAIGCSIFGLLSLSLLGLVGSGEALVRPEASPSASVVFGPLRDASGGVYFGPFRPGASFTLWAGAPATHTGSTSRPVALMVPAVGIDAPIESAGVDASGRFAVPSAGEVGWYEHGPVPGGDGAAVLAAHVDLEHTPGAFFHLADVVPGDKVVVGFSDGSERTFVVVDDVLYDKTYLPAEELFRRSGDPVLHLITCGGTFDPVTRHYQGNRVVTALPA